MAEESKYLGELGEDFAKLIIGRFNWKKMCDWNFDIPCENRDHKTDSGKKQRETHGLDAVYSYQDPYSNQTVVVILEAKALSWQSSEKSKTEKSLALQLNEFIDALSEKISCAKRSSAFRKKTGIPDSGVTIVGMLAYFVHKGFDHNKMQELRQKIILPSGAVFEPIFLLTNEEMENVLTMSNYLGKDPGHIEFFYPDLERFPGFPSQPWLDFLSLEQVFSSFLVLRKKASDQLSIVYRVLYSQQAIRRLCAALGRFQLYSHSKLSFVPVREPSVGEDRHAVAAHTGENEISVAGRDIKLHLEATLFVKAAFGFKD